jgi:hypothetical protein
MITFLRPPKTKVRSVIAIDQTVTTLVLFSAPDEINLLKQPRTSKSRKVSTEVNLNLTEENGQSSNTSKKKSLLIMYVFLNDFE